MEIINSCFYLFSVIAGIGGYYFVRKKTETMNGVCSFFLSIILLMCYQSLAGVALAFCKIAVSNLTVGIANLGFAGICLAVIVKKKEIQRYQYDVSDLIVVVFFAIIAVGLGRYQFGSELSLANYETVDYARHIGYARAVAVNHTVIVDRPFMAINSGLLFEVARPFTAPYLDYRLFIFVDIFMLFMAGIIFWAFIRKYLKGRYMLLAGVLAAIFYVLGYPLSNMVCGTSYCGAGVTVSIAIFILMNQFMEKELRSSFFIPSMAVAFVGLLTAYTLFFPIVFVGVVVHLTLHFLLNRSILDKKQALMALTILCIACFLAICGIFKMSLEAVAPIQAEGFMYRNLIGDYVFLLPFIVYRVYRCYKQKELSFDLTMCLFLVAYIFSFLYADCIGEISSYYFYKNYYLFWVLPFYMMIAELAGCDKGKREFVSVYCLSVLSLYIFIFSGFNAYLEKQSKAATGYSVNSDSQFSRMFQIYQWNAEHGHPQNIHISPASQELFCKLAELNQNPNKPVPYIGPYNIWEEFHYFALAYQWENVIREYNYREGERYIEWVKNEAEYLCLVYREGTNQIAESVEINEELAAYLSTLEIVYQNDAGCIYSVK
jgi:hypothetical protein